MFFRKSREYITMRRAHCVFVWSNAKKPNSTIEVLLGVLIIAEAHFCDSYIHQKCSFSPNPNPILSQNPSQSRTSPPGKHQITNNTNHAPAITSTTSIASTYRQRLSNSAVYGFFALANTKLSIFSIARMFFFTSRRICRFPALYSSMSVSSVSVSVGVSVS